MINEKKIISASEMPAKHQFPGIDIMKFIGAFMVFMIHTAPLWEDKYMDGLSLNFFIQNYISRVTVPFYFMAAGFLLFRKIDLQNPDVSILKKYCFRILGLWAAWSVLLVTVNNYQMWYMTALAVATMIVGVLIVYKVKMRYIGIMSVFLYVIGLLGDSYYGFVGWFKQYQILDLLIVNYEKYYYHTRNGVFMGVIFVFLGAVYAKKKIAMDMKWAVLGFVLSLWLYYKEMIWVTANASPKDLNMYASLVPVCFFLFYILTHVHLKERPIYPRLRVIGMFMFYLHLAVKEQMELGFNHIQQYKGVYCWDKLFIVTLLVTVLVSVGLEWLSHKKKFTWITWLY